MIQIAAIRPNNFNFENTTYDDIKTSKLNDILRPYIDILKVEYNAENELLQNISQLFECTETNICRTNKCYEDHIHDVYLMYIADDENIINNDKFKCDVNHLGRFMSEKHEPVLGRCILLNTRGSTNCDITFDMVIEIIRSKIFHRGIMVSPSGEIRETCFIQNPIENTHFTEKNSRCIHIEFLDRIICVFLECIPLTDKYNKLATILCKQFRIHGDIIVGLVMKYPAIEVIDIDMDMFNKILCIRSNTSTRDVDGFNGEPNKQNFYYVLDQYSQKFDNIINENIPDDVFNVPSMNVTLR